MIFLISLFAKWKGNLCKLKRLCFWGVSGAGSNIVEKVIGSTAYGNIIKAIKSEDLISVYVKNPVSEAVGIYRATSSYYEDHSKVWPDGNFYFRF